MTGEVATNVSDGKWGTPPSISMRSMLSIPVVPVSSARLVIVTVWIAFESPVLVYKRTDGSKLGLAVLLDQLTVSQPVVAPSKQTSAEPKPGHWYSVLSNG